LGLDLVKSVDFGMFGVIAKVLLWGLRYFHSLTNNYGWAIIILTFYIQFLLLPLTIKNYRHSNRMRELQPHIKKLQDQFKSDPKRLQAETFNLYKRHGMKFMGMEGCFPILLQIPVFIAFYATLRAAYELRGAPWIFWIKDLGVYDPYYVLPILMGVGMFLQQKMTSVATDPAQARMMYMMPFIFTFMFFKLPAGLVLYWCVNSMTTIVIQSLMPKPAASPPAS
jgi:YidC/Oxa1 family membrane protein insertase